MEDSAKETVSDVDRAATTTTITTKSSADLNARLAASLTHWNARRATTGDEFRASATDNSDLNRGAQVRGRITTSSDVADSRAAQETVTSSSGQPISAATSSGSDRGGGGGGARIALTADVTDVRAAPEAMTSSRRVAETSTTVQASGTRSTPAVQPLTAAAAATSPGAQPATRQTHSVSMSDMLNVEQARTDDDRAAAAAATSSRPRSTIYGEIRDRVFGAKHQPPRPAASKFEPPLRDEAGKKVSAAERSKQDVAVVTDSAAIATARTQLTSGAVSRASEAVMPSVPPATRFVGSVAAETKDLPQVKTTASRQVPSARQTASASLPESSRGDSIQDGVSNVVPSQQPGQVLPSTVTRQYMQIPPASDDVTVLQRQKEIQAPGRHGSSGLGRPVMTTAEVPPWTQAQPSISGAQRRSDLVTSKVELSQTGAAGTQQMGSVLQSRATAAETVPISRPTDRAVLPAVSAPGTRTTTVGKIIASPTSRVDWAKQRFGADAGAGSSPRLKRRTVSVPQPERDVADEKVLSNLDESIAMLAAAAAAKVATPTSAVQEQPRASTAVATSAAGSPPSTTVHGLPFRPLTVSPPATVSSRVAIVHGLQMSPPASSTAPRTGTEPGGSTWVDAGRPQRGGVMPTIGNDATAGFRSTMSSATSTAALPPSDVRVPGKPVQPAVDVSASQRPLPSPAVPPSASVGPAIHSHAPPAPVVPPAVVPPAPPGVGSVPSVSSSYLASTAPTTAPPMSAAAMFSMETPAVTPVLARPALPTVAARVSQPDRPQIRLSVKPLKPAVVTESPVPESKLVLVAPKTASAAISQKSAADANVPTSASCSRMEDTKASYSTAAAQEPPRSRTQQVETIRTSSQPELHVAVSQPQVPASAHRTDVVITPNQVQSRVQAGQTGTQQVRTPTQTQPNQIGPSAGQASKPAQLIQPAVPQAQTAAAAQPSVVPRVEARGHGQTSQVPGVSRFETKSTSVATVSSAMPATATFVVAQKGGTSQTAADRNTRSRQEEERPAGTAAVPDRQVTAAGRSRDQVVQHLGKTAQVPDRQIIAPAGTGDQKRQWVTATVPDRVPDRQLAASSAVAKQRDQVEQHPGRNAQVPDRRITISSGPGEQKRRGGPAAVDDEVDRALRALDSIAAETRSLSTSLDRSAAAASTTTSTTSALRQQTSPASRDVNNPHLHLLFLIFQKFEFLYY